MDRVPNVEAAVADFFPWILCGHMNVAEREVAHLAVVVSAPTSAAAGDYSSAIRLNTGLSHVDIPLLVHVLRCGGGDPPSSPTFGVFGYDYGTMLYGSLALRWIPRNRSG